MTAAEGRSNADNVSVEQVNDMVGVFGRLALPSADNLVAWLAEAGRQAGRVATAQEFSPRPLRVEQLTALMVGVAHVLAGLRRVVGGVQRDAESWATLPADLVNGLVWNGRQPGGTWEAIDVAQPPAEIRADLLKTLAGWFGDVDADFDVTASHVGELVELLKVVGHRLPSAPVEVGEGDAS